MLSLSRVEETQMTVPTAEPIRRWSREENRPTLTIRNPRKVTTSDSPTYSQSSSGQHSIVDDWGWSSQSSTDSFQATIGVESISGTRCVIESGISSIFSYET